MGGQTTRRLPTDLHKLWLFPPKSLRPWSSFSPPNVECGDSSPHGSESGDESPHSKISPIGLNDDQGHLSRASGSAVDGYQLKAGQFKAVRGES